MRRFPSDPLRALAWRTHALPRRAAARVGAAVSVEGVDLAEGGAGKLVQPRAGGPLPGVVVSPPIHAGVDALLGYSCVVSAAEIARLGFVVALHDPAGRGSRAHLPEDFGGPVHQAELLATIRALRAHPSCTGSVGVLSLSLGIAAAVGALASDPGLAAWLLDWEGPSDREIVTSGGAKLAPAAGHAMTDDRYWHPREATRRLREIGCGYARLQADPDHAQPGELRHATRMLRAAEGLPWLQVNDHPRGVVPTRPSWLRGGPLAANAAILAKLRGYRERESAPAP